MISAINKQTIPATQSTVRNQRVLATQTRSDAFRSIFGVKTASMKTTASTAVSKSAQVAAESTAASSTSPTAASQAAVSTPTALSTQGSATTATSAAGPVVRPVSSAFGTPTDFENHMNQWLMKVLQDQNDRVMQVYNNALAGWNNVAARNRELGLPVPPQPQSPQLAKIEPMPAGWWYTITS